MKLIQKKIPVFLLAVLMMLALAAPAYAAGADGTAPVTAEETEAAQTEDGGSVTGSKSYAVAIAIGLAAAGGAVAMGLATAKAVEGIARQPEAEGKIRTAFMLGLVFIETAIIYALLAVILIIFVL